jgi:hypothetical protein
LSSGFGTTRPSSLRSRSWSRARPGGTVHSRQRQRLPW